MHYYVLYAYSVNQIKSSKYILLPVAEFAIVNKVIQATMSSNKTIFIPTSLTASVTVFASSKRDSSSLMT